MGKPACDFIDSVAPLGFPRQYDPERPSAASVPVQINLFPIAMIVGMPALPGIGGKIAIFPV